MTYRDQRTLEQTKLELTQWRAENAAPTPLPSDIWEKAVQLARRHGVGQVARALRLDHGALRRRVDGLGPGGSSSPAAPATFIELLPLAPPAVIGRCDMQVESRRGHEVRLTLSDVGPSALATLIREVLA